MTTQKKNKESNRKLFAQINKSRLLLCRDEIEAYRNSIKELAETNPKTAEIFLFSLYKYLDNMSDHRLLPNQKQMLKEAAQIIKKTTEPEYYLYPEINYE